MDNSTVVVSGLKEFRKAVMALQDNKDFAAAMKRVADIVADDARSRAPHVDGNFRRSIRSRAAGAGARVVWGGPRAIYAPWLEFGGRKHAKKIGKTTGRTQPVDRARLERGRYVYPAIDRNQDKIQAQVLKEMNTLIARYGLSVEETAPEKPLGKMSADGRFF